MPEDLGSTKHRPFAAEGTPGGERSELELRTGHGTANKSRVKIGGTPTIGGAVVPDGPSHVRPPISNSATTASYRARQSGS
jgi:hypothetical protein